MDKVLGELQEKFYCKKRDKNIQNMFEIDNQFCVDCEPYDNADCFVSRLQIIDIDEDGEKV